MSRMCHSLNQPCSGWQCRPLTLADCRFPRLTLKSTVHCSALACGTCDSQSLLQDSDVAGHWCLGWGLRPHLVHFAVGLLDTLWDVFGRWPFPFELDAFCPESSDFHTFKEPFTVSWCSCAASLCLTRVLAFSRVRSVTVWRCLDKAWS